MQVFVMTNTGRTVINADGNVKNWLIKIDVMVGIYGMLVCVNVNVKKRVILMST